MVVIYSDVALAMVSRVRAKARVGALLFMNWHRIRDIA